MADRHEIRNAFLIEKPDTDFIQLFDIFLTIIRRVTKRLWYTFDWIVFQKNVFAFRFVATLTLRRTLIN